MTFLVFGASGDFLGFFMSGVGFGFR